VEALEEHKLSCNLNAFVVHGMGAIDINCVLSHYSLFKIKIFFYILIDCLFDSFTILLQFHYTSLEIHQGIVAHFQK
jgi:hypothetical protein